MRGSTAAESIHQSDDDKRPSSSRRLPTHLPLTHSLTHSSVHRHRHDVFNPAAVTPAQTRPARLPACAFLLVLHSLNRSLKTRRF